MPYTTTRYSTLSGSDITGDEPVRQVINNYLLTNSSLSGTDRNAPISSNNDIAQGRGDAVLPGHNGGVAINTAPVNAETQVVIPGCGLIYGDPNYHFYGSMSEEILHRYLDKCIAMDNLCNLWHPNRGSADLPNAFASDMSLLTDIGPKMVLALGEQSYLSVEGNTELNDLFTAIGNTVSQLKMYDGDIICGASLVENINIYFTNNPPTPIPYYVFHDLGITSVKRGSNLAVGGIVDTPVSAPFGWVYGAPGYKNALSVPRVTFDAGWMQRNILSTADPDTGASSFSAPTKTTTTPDITLVETQLFYYYLATKYIDNGCEAISLSDYYEVNAYDTPTAHSSVGQRGYDPGTGSSGITIANQNTWLLFSAIRVYAAKYACRGVVLLSAYQDGTRNYSYDPGATHSWEQQLLFDFWEARVPLTRTSSPPCTPEYQPLVYNPSTPLGLLGASPGGLNPQGWLCVHNPFVLDFDQGAGALVNVTGCAFVNSVQTTIPCGTNSPETDISGIGVPCNQSDEFCGYGWDSITWFASQGNINNPANNPFIRNSILLYLYYGAKGYDPFGHFWIPGRQFITKFWCGPNEIYRASADTVTDVVGGTVMTSPGYQQQQTIKDLWNGVFAGPKYWVNHNFTKENVVDTDMSPTESLIFAGQDRMYFISSGVSLNTDGYIHGYVRMSNSTYNGGTWATVSPSYASQVPASAQVKAASDLVASPDGNTLLYIGVDGYLHGFQIIDDWHYTYFDFMKDDMIAQGVTAYSAVSVGSFSDSVTTGTLIYPENDRIYYIGKMTNGSQYVFGFYKTGSPYWPWLRVNPSLICDSSNINGQFLYQQYQAAGALTYDIAKQRLYYRATGVNGGYLAYFEVQSILHYNWVPCPGNLDLNTWGAKITGNLAIYGNMIYFVGYNGSYFLYCLIEDASGNWGLDSLAVSAQINGQAISTQSQSVYTGQVAVSADGNTIAYFSGSPQLCYYSYNGPGNYSYYEGPAAATVSANSLQFMGNDMYFIDEYYVNNVHRIVFEEDYLANPNFLVIQEGIQL